MNYTKLKSYLIKIGVVNPSEDDMDEIIYIVKMMLKENKIGVDCDNCSDMGCEKCINL